MTTSATPSRCACGATFKHKGALSTHLAYERCGKRKGVRRGSVKCRPTRKVLELYATEPERERFGGFDDARYSYMHGAAYGK
jgi:hypothetical protein